MNKKWRKQDSNQGPLSLEAVLLSTGPLPQLRHLRQIMNNNSLVLKRSLFHDYVVWDRLSGHVKNSNDDRTSFILGRRWWDSRSKIPSFLWFQLESIRFNWNRFDLLRLRIRKRNVCDEEAVPPVSDLFLKKIVMNWWLINEPWFSLLLIAITKQKSHVATLH